jgi:endonuclease/exonuclease/phosphatase family metal-dependent hydrolase
MDANADADLPEMEWLRSKSGGGFSDVFLDYWASKVSDKLPNTSAGILQQSGAPHCGFTWDQENTLTFGMLVEPNQRMDYIMMKQGAESKQKVHTLNADIALDAPALSDHYAVCASLQLS